MKTLVGKIFVEHFEAEAMFIVAGRDFAAKNLIRLKDI